MAFFRIATVALNSIALCSFVSGDYVWPNDKTDVIEGMLYEQKGFKSTNVATLVANCTGGGGIGRPGQNFGAEWLRNAYHDMATADVLAGTGGLDASIVFESDRAENVGGAFAETLASFLSFVTSRSTLSDLFALATVFALGACSGGNVLIPMRAGRIDATDAGPAGVPEPQQDLESHTASFARQGFTANEMIALVACGHSIGGVHGVDFPQIVPRPANNTVRHVPFSNEEGTVTFDTTTNDFDNKVAIEFVGNVSQNPLAFGQNETTRSDFRIFNLDGGKMISDMAASNDFFLSTCTDLLARMINTVPRGVVLSNVIQPVEVKPRDLRIDLAMNGTMTVSGNLRILQSLLGPASEVRVYLRPRSGGDCSTGSACTVVTTTTISGGSTTCLYPNCGPNFDYHNFSAVVPAAQGVSSFTVEIIRDGVSTIKDNAGHGFPWPDTLQPQLAMSSQGIVFDNSSLAERLNLTVAVLNAEQFTDITMTLFENALPRPTVAHYRSSNISMTRLTTIPGTNYTLFTGLYKSPPNTLSQHPYDVVATAADGSTVTNAYNLWSLVPHA
ncbi:heme peroxidase [Thozetella sp. PMI_491]|nr:heme peroxidase [Thozetella sp. PMI_491]